MFSCHSVAVLIDLENNRFRFDLVPIAYDTAESPALPTICVCSSIVVATPTHRILVISHCGVAAEVRVSEALRRTWSSAPDPTGRQSTATGRAIVFSLLETGEYLLWRREAVCMPVQSQCPPRAQTGHRASSRVC